MDVYIGMEDYFQARETIKVILANVSVAWVVDDANAKLQVVDQLEYEKNNPPDIEEEEINLNGTDDTGNQDILEEDNSNENTPAEGE